MDVNAVLKPFMREATGTTENRSRLARLLAAAQTHIASAPRNTLSKVGEDLRVLMRLLKAFHRREYTALSKKTIALVVAGVAYFVAPVDAIPDMLPIVGFVDDVAVLAWVCNSIRGELDSFRTWESEHYDGSEQPNVC